LKEKRPSKPMVRGVPGAGGRLFVQRGFVLFQVAYQGSAVSGAFFAVA